MVSNHFKRVIREILGACFARRGSDERHKQINLVIGVHMLQDSRNTLKPHTRINTRLWKRRHIASGIPLELHKHQIPNLDITITVLLRRSRRATPDFRSMIIENLSAWTTRSSIRHLPEVIRCVAGAFVITDTDDTLRRHTNFLFPYRVGFVILLVDRDPKLFLR